ncbi:hypothetical protein D9M72_575330 [compost metagenome]
MSLRLVLRQRPRFLKVGHADVVGPDPVLAGLLGQSAPQVRLPGSGESLKHDVLLPFDERTRAELGDHVPVQTTLVHEVEPAQIRARVA